MNSSQFHLGSYSHVVDDSYTEESQNLLFQFQLEHLIWIKITRQNNSLRNNSPKITGRLSALSQAIAKLWLLQ